MWIFYGVWAHLVLGTPGAVAEGSHSRTLRTQRTQRTQRTPRTLRAKADRPGAVPSAE